MATAQGHTNREVEECKHVSLFFMSDVYECSPRPSLIEKQSSILIPSSFRHSRRGHSKQANSKLILGTISLEPGSRGNADLAILGILYLIKIGFLFFFLMINAFNIIFNIY